MATTTTTTSILNTPQAVDDYYGYTESEVLDSNNILVLDVMSNDSGGKSKTLYSIEASEEFIQALATRDGTGEANAQYFNGVKVWIENGKLMVDVSGADALAALGAQSIEDLDADQQLDLSFSYTIQLGNGTLSVATVHLTIIGEGEGEVNAPPTVVPVMLNPGVEDTPRTITADELLDGASDVDGDTLTITELTLTSGGGELLSTGTGTWTYVPAPDAFGTVTFSYQVFDGSVATTNTASLVIAQGTTDTDTEATGTIEFAGSMHVGELLTASVSNLDDQDGLVNASGHWQVLRNGTWTDIEDSYQRGLFLDPDEQLTEGTQVRFRLETWDQQGGTTIIDSTPVTLLAFRGDTEATGTVSLSPGSTDPVTGQIETIAAVPMEVTDPNGGIDHFNYQWQKSANPDDPDSWTDIGGATSQDLDAKAPELEGLYVRAKVQSVDLLGLTTDFVSDHQFLPIPNQAPEAIPITLAAGFEDTPRTITSAQLLAGATDVDGDALTVIGLTLTSGSGTLAVNGSEWTYTPGANDHTTATFSYGIFDGHHTTPTTATLQITPVNDAPVAHPDTATADENATVTVTVLANDTDADQGAVFTVTGAWAPSGKGTATVSASNEVVFDPGRDFDHLAEGQSEPVIITYTIRDQDQAESTSILTITVTGSDDGPVARPDGASAPAGQDIVVDVLSNDDAPDRVAPLTLRDVSVIDGGGTAEVVENKLVYHPGDAFRALAFGESATVHLTYTVADENEATATGSVTLTIDGVNDGPTAADDGGTTSPYTSLTIDVLANDSDPDNGETAQLMLVASGLPDPHFSIVGDQVLFDPGTDFLNLYVGETQSVQYTYTVADPSGMTSDGVVTVNVVGTNNPLDILTGIDRGAVVSTITQATSGTIAAISGTIAFTDIDLDATEHYTVSVRETGYGTLTASISFDGALRTIDWTFTATQEAIDDLDLSSGDMLPQAAGYIVISSNLQGDVEIPLALALTIEDTGAGTVNSPPFLAADEGFDLSTGFSGTLSEDAIAPLTWWAMLGDADPGESTFRVTGAETGQYGTFSYNAGSATWTYALNANAQALVAGQEVDETVYQAVSADGQLSFPISVKVTGMNDAPALIASTIAHTYENTLADDAFASITGTLSRIDPDNGDTPTYRIIGGSLDTSRPGYDTSLATTYGTLYLHSASGAYEFVPLDAALESHASSATVSQTFTLHVTDLWGATDTESLVISVHRSSQPAPIIQTTTAQLPAGWVIPDVGGKLSLDDSGTGQTLFAIPTNLQGRFGSFEFLQDGTWRYTMDNDSDAVRNIQPFPAEPNQDRLVVTSLDGSVAEEIVVDIMSLWTPEGIHVTGGDDSEAFSPQASAEEEQTIWLATTHYNDIIFGMGGDDRVDAGGGNDWVSGGLGNDILRAGTGVDTLMGDEGDDYLQSEDGLSFTGTYALMNGGAGNDFLHGSRHTQDVFVMGTTLNATTNVDIVANFGSTYPGAPQDYFLLKGGLFLGLDALPDGTLAADSFDVFGSPVDVTASNDDDARIFAVRNTADLVRTDLLNPGTQVTHNDHLDLFYDPTGGDTSDAIQFASILVGSEGLTLEASAFRITGTFGTSGDDTMTGTEGEDILSGLAGDDILSGAGGNDLLAGGLGSDVLEGGEGDDILRGGAGSDFLDGGAGNDELIGGAGTDDLAGGEGDDLFFFNPAIVDGAYELATIHDFTRDGGEADVMVLSAQAFGAISADASGVLADGQVITWAGSVDALSSVGDTVRIIYAPPNGAEPATLYYDPDGGSLDNAMAFAMLEQAPSTLDASSFLLG